MIRAVRRVYHPILRVGSLSTCTIWNAEFIGISAYFELTNDRKATESDLVLSRKIRFVLLDWISTHSKPLLFTELGYPGVDGGAVKPWDYTTKGTIDLEEQRRAFSAFRTVWQDEPALAGVYFWWWGPKDGENAWYTIPGKPAMSEVKSTLRRGGSS